MAAHKAESLKTADTLLAQFTTDRIECQKQYDEQIQRAEAKCKERMLTKDEQIQVAKDKYNEQIRVADSRYAAATQLAEASFISALKAFKDVAPDADSAFLTTEYAKNRLEAAATRDVEKRLATQVYETALENANHDREAAKKEFEENKRFAEQLRTFLFASIRKRYDDEYQLIMQSKQPRSSISINDSSSKISLSYHQVYLRHSRFNVDDPKEIEKHLKFSSRSEQFKGIFKKGSEAINTAKVQFEKGHMNQQLKEHHIQDLFFTFACVLLSQNETFHTASSSSVGSSSRVSSSVKSRPSESASAIIDSFKLTISHILTEATAASTADATTASTADATAASNMNLGTIVRDTHLNGDFGPKTSAGDNLKPDLTLTTLAAGLSGNITAYHVKAIIELKTPNENLTDTDKGQLCQYLVATLKATPHRGHIWGMLTNGSSVFFAQATQSETQTPNIKVDFYLSPSLTSEIGSHLCAAFILAGDEFFGLAKLPVTIPPGCEFKLLRSLGQGVSGQVHEIELLQANHQHYQKKKQCVIKIFNRSEDFNSELSNLCKVGSRLAGTDNIALFPTVIHQIEMASEKALAAIIMDPVGVSAFKFKHNGMTSKCVAQLVNLVVECCEKAQLVHYDIRPANIVFVKTSQDPHQLMLVDWAFAFAVDQRFHVCGTLTYAAPEVLQARRDQQQIQASLAHALQSVVRVVLASCIDTIRDELSRIKSRNVYDERSLVTELIAFWADVFTYSTYSRMENAAKEMNVEVLLSQLDEWVPLFMDGGSQELDPL